MLSIISFRNYLFFCFLGCLALELSAHGLIESPPSRAWYCGAVTKPDEIVNGVAKFPVCSTAFAIKPTAAFNFMAIVTHSLGRSSVTPLPKNVCGFDGETWKGEVTPWDVPMEWPTHPMKPGMQSILWNISWGPHFDDTFEFRYWMTKSDYVFSPSKALTWQDFEAEPFCVVNYDDKNATANPNAVPNKSAAKITTNCLVPERSGHHVIYGEWGRLPPTNERFHSCVDVSFAASLKVIRPPPRKVPEMILYDFLGRLWNKNK